MVGLLNSASSGERCSGLAIKISLRPALCGDLCGTWRSIGGLGACVLSANVEMPYPKKNVGGTQDAVSLRG